MLALLNLAHLLEFRVSLKPTSRWCLQNSLTQGPFVWKVQMLLQKLYPRCVGICSEAKRISAKLSRYLVVQKLYTKAGMGSR